jgi:hypothetical protein
MALVWDGDRVLRELQGITRGIAEGLAKDVAEEAQRQAPFRTGRLRASIGAISGPDGAEWLVVAAAPYAQFVHEGSRGHAGNPFLLRAVAAVAARGRSAIARHVR